MEKPAHTHTHAGKQSTVESNIPLAILHEVNLLSMPLEKKMFGYTTDNYNLLVLTFHFVHPLTKIWVELGPFCQSSIKQVDLPLYFLCLLVIN
jgi:hypothetical protein